METETISAVFNQKIESPGLNSNTPYVYDLSRVITVYGMDTVDLRYRLFTQDEYVLLDGINLSIYNGAIGNLEISVSDGKNEATASTAIYGYNATITRLNNKDGFDNLKSGIITAKKEYQNIISGSLGSSGTSGTSGSSGTSGTKGTFNTAGV